ncbi:short chain dehydrogenase [Nitrosomonas sp. Nm51]|uniref:SDR family NAD(P)-dependent oxidoreductase n=1 Tax=Nitrosomonas sp. Nm51 TaxID=133720 RepID=UPI0008B1AB16|nr:SDR family NAD(P)-dependent oxidoreductase [Nitrosomonas sp. Nm51]SEQ96600.1 short chain dehydrogenase [Nitrosomonas sp. Nm51]
MTPSGSALVAGVGPEQGLGAALARCFAKNGLHVFISGRSEDKLHHVASTIQQSGGNVTSIAADITVENSVRSLFDQIRARGDIIQVAAYNVDSNIPSPFLETSAEAYTTLWQQNCLGAFLFAQHLMAIMQAQKQGTVFFTGATASLRARPPFTAFAAAKAGLRALAQGLAREFSPQGIHVVHTVIDGVINGERARRQFPDYVKAKGADGLLELEAIVQTYWAIHLQPRSAWTHELDLRPYKETF